MMLYFRDVLFLAMFLCFTNNIIIQNRKLHINPFVCHTFTYHVMK